MNQFLAALDRFVAEVEAMPRFKGQAHAIKNLKRIKTLSVFNK